ncbi:MAG TPA: Mur ligase family protein, partial [Thermomicrobiales bacterium]|nr:Mur ligase family protein [Thermomicrobiales bacterium]
MNYREALIYFRDRSDYERGFVSNPFAGDEAAATGLRRTRLLLDQLGSPDRAYPIIHVAGTKGKGSTCAFIESMTRHCGLRTGLFATPQLHSVRERTLIDAQPISEAQFAETLGRVAAAVEQVERAHPEAGSLTAFEISTAQSLLAFAEAGVDLAVVEAGMGGRLDATNVIEKPAISVITPVSVDHTEYLGKDIAAIAGEKAGIMKKGVPCVIGPQSEEAMAVLSARALQLNTPVMRHGHEWHVETEGDKHIYKSDTLTLELPRPALAGEHQWQNAATAVAVMDALAQQDIGLD